ncbi:hypothetical protein V8E53_003541 [Lactarius tabidus]
MKIQRINEILTKSSLLVQAPVPLEKEILSMVVQSRQSERHYCITVSTLELVVVVVAVFAIVFAVEVVAVVATVTGVVVLVLRPQGLAVSGEARQPPEAPAPMSQGGSGGTWKDPSV